MKSQFSESTVRKSVSTRFSDPYEEFVDVLGPIKPETRLYHPFNGSETADSLVPSSTLADWLGVVERTVEQLGRSGVLKPEKLPGHTRKHYYGLKSSVQRYAESLRARVAGRNSTADAAYTAARTRKAEADAAKSELALSVQAGRVVEKTSVIREWSTRLAAIRTALLQVPGTLRMELPHLTAEDHQIIDRVIRDALTNAGGQTNA